MTIVITPPLFYPKWKKWFYFKISWGVWPLWCSMSKCPVFWKILTLNSLKFGNCGFPTHSTCFTWFVQTTYDYFPFLYFLPFFPGLPLPMSGHCLSHGELTPMGPPQDDGDLALWTRFPFIYCCHFYGTVLPDIGHHVYGFHQFLSYPFNTCPLHRQFMRLSLVLSNHTKILQWKDFLRF